MTAMIRIEQIVSMSQVDFGVNVSQETLETEPHAMVGQSSRIFPVPIQILQQNETTVLCLLLKVSRHAVIRR